MLPTPGVDVSALFGLLQPGLDLSHFSNLLLQPPPPFVPEQQPIARNDSAAFPIIHPTPTYPQIQPILNQTQPFINRGFQPVRPNRNAFCPLPGLSLVGRYEPAVMRIEDMSSPESVHRRSAFAPRKPETEKSLESNTTSPVQNDVPCAIEPEFHIGRIPVSNYLPTHFMRGTAIQVANGKLKNVEDLSSDDFLMSAACTDYVSVETSTISSISTSRDMARISFILSSSGQTIGLEVQIEHPFFSIGKGWCSCDPVKTKQSYGLDSEHLKVGDVCVALAVTDESEEPDDIGILEAQKRVDDNARRRDLTYSIQMESGRTSAPLPLSFSHAPRSRTWSEFREQ